MDEANLVGVHEAGIAHHVAAVGQIDGQHRSAAVQHRAGAVVMQLLIVVGANVAAGKYVFQMLEERGVHGHHVFEVAVDRAIFHHQDLAVALDDLRLDLAGLLVHQHFDRQLAVDDLLANFGNALGAERVGGARPAQRRLRLLIRLQQRLVGPLGRKRRIRIDTVQFVEDCPSALGSDGDSLFNILNRFVHLRLSKLDGGGLPTGAKPTPIYVYKVITRSRKRPSRMG